MFYLGLTLYQRYVADQKTCFYMIITLTCNLKFKNKSILWPLNSFLRSSIRIACSKLTLTQFLIYKVSTLEAILWN